MTTDLAAAATEYERLERRVREVGEDSIRETAGTHHSFVKLLDRYEERATGSGFEEYLEFQDAVAELLDDVDEEVPAYDAFEAADDAVHQRRLSTSDFDRAREALAPAGDYAELLRDWEEAAERLHDARRAARSRLNELDGEISDRERLLELGDADLDAPIERLRDPIETYDERVREAFDTFRRDAPARELFDLVAVSEQFPLVEFRAPPPRLRDYLADASAGDESVLQLLDYADYSASKLNHYIDDPGQFNSTVATNRTYLTELDAEPLTVGWPPPTAGELRYATREYLAVCNRFASNELVEALRRVRDLPRATDYERLRRSAEARAELGAGERERLANGRVETELSELRTERKQLQEKLGSAPEP